VAETRSGARKVGIGTYLVLGLLVLILLALGTWQVERLQWKEGLIAEIEARRHAPPMSIAELASMAKPDLEAEYRPMTVSGHFDHAGEQYFYATDDGRVGYHVYTPLTLNDGRVLFVNRGFVPDEFRDPAKRAAGQIEGEVTVTGLYRRELVQKPSWLVPENEPVKRLYFWKDLEAMAAAAKVPGGRLEHFFLDADATPNPGGWPKGGVTQIDLPNNHLSYAVTWYGLAIVLIIVSVLAIRRKAR
jgi:surfeit locus 1 family protein